MPTRPKDDKDGDELAKENTLELSLSLRVEKTASSSEVKLEFAPKSKNFC